MKIVSINQHEPHLLKWLHIDPDARPTAYSDIFASADVGQLSYWLEIVFAAGIATFGLVQNSPAVIIGAMLISPLMGPIMATGLALAVGDVYLGVRAAVNLISSIVVAVAFSATVVWLLPFHSATNEILGRTNPNLLDLGVALFSGLAGSVAVSRYAGKGGGATALPGVAIAVALMPPLCTVGFGLGSGLNLAIMGGAGLLFLTNLVAIVASAFVVFLLIGMDTPGVNARVQTSREDDALAQFLLHSPIGKIVQGGGHLRWRILMIVIVLGSVAVPLGKALVQVAGETIARGVVQNELKDLVASDSIVTQQVRISPGRIEIRLISTQPIAAAKVHEVEQAITQRTGRTARLSVDAVASKTELADMMERLKAPASAAAISPGFGDMQREAANQIRPAILEIWPSTEAPVRDVSLGLDPEHPVVHISYEAEEDLGAIPAEILVKGLRARLSAPDLSLNLERVAPAPAQDTGAIEAPVEKKGSRRTSGAKGAMSTPGQKPKKPLPQN